MISRALLDSLINESTVDVTETEDEYGSPIRMVDPNELDSALDRYDFPEECGLEDGDQPFRGEVFVSFGDIERWFHREHGGAEMEDYSKCPDGACAVLHAGRN
jgi:hypothetical protein